MRFCWSPTYSGHSVRWKEPDHYDLIGIGFEWLTGDTFVPVRAPQEGRGLAVAGTFRVCLI